MDFHHSGLLLFAHVSQLGFESIPVDQLHARSPETQRFLSLVLNALQHEILMLCVHLAAAQQVFWDLLTSLAARRWYPTRGCVLRPRRRELSQNPGIFTQHEHTSSHARWSCLLCPQFCTEGCWAIPCKAGAPGNHRMIRLYISILWGLLIFTYVHTYLKVCWFKLSPPWLKGAVNMRCTHAQYMGSSPGGGIVIFIEMSV